VLGHAQSLSRILRLALRLHAPEACTGHLRNALKSRAAVDAAIALIMLQHRGGREDALELLQVAAKFSDRRIQDIAGTLWTEEAFPPPGWTEARNGHRGSYTGH
jgi:AmiR/NasT family two-component response regulator